MSDDQQLGAFLVFAKTLTASDPFDARAALDLLRATSAVIQPHANHALGTVIGASLAALDSRQDRGSAIARYALTRVVIEIEGYLERATT